MNGNLKQECYNKVKKRTEELKDRGCNFILYKGIKFVNYGAEHYDVFDTSGEHAKYSKISNKLILEALLDKL